MAKDRKTLLDELQKATCYTQEHFLSERYADERAAGDPQEISLLKKASGVLESEPGFFNQLFPDLSDAWSKAKDEDWEKLKAPHKWRDGAPDPDSFIGRWIQPQIDAEAGAKAAKEIPPWHNDPWQWKDRPDSTHFHVFPEQLRASIQFVLDMESALIKGRAISPTIHKHIDTLEQHATDMAAYEKHYLDEHSKKLRKLNQPVRPGEERTEEELNFAVKMMMAEGAFPGMDGTADDHADMLTAGDMLQKLAKHAREIATELEISLPPGHKSK